VVAVGGRPVGAAVRVDAAVRVRVGRLVGVTVDLMGTGMRAGWAWQGPAIRTNISRPVSRNQRAGLGGVRSMDLGGCKLYSRYTWEL